MLSFLANKDVYSSGTNNYSIAKTFLVVFTVLFIFFNFIDTLIAYCHMTFIVIWRRRNDDTLACINHETYRTKRRITDDDELPALAMRRDATNRTVAVATAAAADAAALDAVIIDIIIVVHGWLTQSGRRRRSSHYRAAGRCKPTTSNDRPSCVHISGRTCVRPHPILRAAPRTENNDVCLVLAWLIFNLATSPRA